MPLFYGRSTFSASQFEIPQQEYGKPPSQRHAGVETLPALLFNRRDTMDTEISNQDQSQTSAFIVPLW
ncbi:MAG: hypothetical protein B7Z37_13310 [Verrucomicrobia bacterium 12-59-8]|nr:MAG: hypothetical protein B7Z37_13310 [Verrucomicrobia bacterium 12-59-8]